MRKNLIFIIFVLTVFGGCKQSSEDNSGLALLALAGAENSQPVNITFTTSSTATVALTDQLKNIFGLYALDSGTTVVNTLKVYVNEIELENGYESSHEGAEDNDENDSEETLINNPFVMTLIENGVPQAVNAGQVNIPAGNYHEVEFSIQQCDDPNEPLMNGKSIYIEGTNNGTPFVMWTNMEQEIEIEANSPINIESSSSVVVDFNIPMVQFDFTNAPLNPDGSGDILIDPTTDTQNTYMLRFMNSLQNQFNFGEDLNDDHELSPDEHAV